MTHQVKTPELGTITPKREDVLKVWSNLVMERAKLTVWLEPAVEAIKAVHYPRRAAYVDWERMEIRYTGGDTYTVLFLFEEYDYDHQSEHSESYTIPLVDALAGRDAVIAHFAEVKRKEEEAAKQMGIARELRLQNDRLELFKKLKLEFEPPETAIVKHKG